MKPGSVAVVGAAETTRLGKIPDVSELELHRDAALNALADAGLTFADIDGYAGVGSYVGEMVLSLGLKPNWVDGTLVGGCSFILMVRHAAAAINAGLCHTVLITHGESGRSQVGALPWVSTPYSLIGQFEMPFGAMDPTTQFNTPVLRYMKDYGLSEEGLATVAVIQREWAALNPRAYVRDPLTVDEVLESRIIAWPIRKLMCCLVTDGGGALILTAAERAADFPRKPVYIMGAGESVESPLTAQIEDLKSGRAFRMAGQSAFAEAGLGPGDIDHLMIYDAFAQLPIWGLEDLGFVGKGEAGDFIAERRTAPGGELPMNTNGGGMSYTHTGMYSMFAMQESIRQMRGTASAQVEGVKISLTHGVGNFFEAGATVIFSNQRP